MAHTKHYDIDQPWNSTTALQGLTGVREREMFYLTTHSTHFIYGFMASDIWLRTILIVRKETRCRQIVLTARVILHAPPHRNDNTYHSLCYTSRGALAGTRNSSMGPPHEGSIRLPIAPWANALPLSYVPLPLVYASNGTEISLNQGWEIIFSIGPHEKQKILWKAGPKGLTQFCLILIVFLYKKPPVNSIVFKCY